MEKISKVPAGVKNSTTINQVDKKITGEAREYLVAAITNSLRWYAQVPDKRSNDDEHAITLIDFLHDLQQD